MERMYIQSDEVGRITDIISYQHEGYIETQVNLPLPVGVLGGAYELRDGSILYRREWDINADIEELHAQIAERDIVMLSLMDTIVQLQGGGVNV